jgi:N-acetylmuramoyl-L-alanine amidase
VRPISEIIIHCTATRADWLADKTAAQKVAEVRKWHTTAPRNWSDIGYHFLIDRDGTVAEGRPIERIGAHVKYHNTGSIGISLFGGHGGEKDGSFADNFTEEQGAALRRLVSRLQAEYGPGLKLSGHHEYANKACPCFDVRSWFARTVPAIRTSPAQSTTLQAGSGVALSVVASAGTAVSQLDGTAQIIVIACAVLAIAGLAWMAKERLKRWARGDR